MPTNPIVVLKLGSSVLRSADDLCAAVQVLYREVRAGRRVVAIVSAFAGTTNRLRDLAHAAVEQPQAAGLAALLGSGEVVSAALLAIALDEAGIPTALLDAERTGLRTDGPLLDASPVELRTEVVREALEEHAVAVLPGFIARDRSGAASLLGRGGSDLTALYLAHRLGASDCRLLKDVAALYTEDPALGGVRQRFLEASWDDLLACGGRLVQAKAVSFAREHGVAFSVAAADGSPGTRVGAGPARLEVRSPEERHRPLRVLLLGLGTVGLGVYRRLRAEPGCFEVAGVAVRDLERPRPAEVERSLLFDDPWQALAEPADVVVEVLGGQSPARELIAAALRAGRHVVTANKAVLAAWGQALQDLAVECSVRLLDSAAVGGAVPMLERVREKAAGPGIVELSGVINGTTNFVLDEIGQGSTFAAAVARAQELGFAEADPTLDLDGSDAAAKLVLLVQAAFAESLAAWDIGDIERQGIERVSPEAVRHAIGRGQVIRLVASARRTADGIAARVAPVELPAKHPLARTRGEQNCLLLTCRDGSTETLRGKGAGRAPTSAAVLADLHDLVRTGGRR